MQRTEAGGQRESFLWLLATTLLGAAAVGVFLYMPIVAGALTGEYKFTPQRVGEFSSLQLVAISAGCFLNVYLSRRCSVRVIGAVTLAVLLLMDLASPHIRDYSLFLVSRVLAGFAGGVAVSLTTGLLARSSRAELGFGFFLTLQITLKIVGLWYLPKVVQALGLQGLFGYMAGIDALALLGVLTMLPGRLLYEKATVGILPRARNGARDWLLCGVLLVGIFAFFNAVGGFWTYVALIGSQAGLSAQTVGSALSLATFGGLAGAIVPVLLQNKAGHVVPAVFASAMLLFSLYLLMVSGAFATYALAAGGFCFGWYMLSPYQLAVLAALDRDGRPSVASAALTGLGLGTGPAIVSEFANSGLSAAYVVGAAGVLLSALLTIVGATAGRSAHRAGVAIVTDVVARPAGG